jgi:hypothetical protein
MIFVVVKWFRGVVIMCIKQYRYSAAWTTGHRWILTIAMMWPFPHPRAHQHTLLGPGVALVYLSHGCTTPNLSTTCKHNIIQIHNKVLWDWQYFADYSSHSDWMWVIFCKILSVPQNTVMNLNIVMKTPNQGSIIFRLMNMHDHDLKIRFMCWFYIICE